ncbi:MAG: carbamoyltransferase family protein [Desulfobacca sp.]|uniref:carbamoyltransferase family protein n=1 Tax=Desulfobacca sp. TaxID=2067990 RepID=UPI00404A74E1
MYILGISAFYHDAGAVLLEDDRIVAAAQEERFTRKKHDPSFPVNAIRFCLKQGGVRLTELAAVAFYDKPFLKFERLLETYYAFAPRGLRSFLAAMPVWFKEKLLLKNLIFTALGEIGGLEKKAKNSLTLLFPEHHLSHAASAFYPSPFAEAAILTIDGVGEWATASICHGRDREITILRELRFPHSLGLLYSAFTYYLGFKVNSGEYKLMGLAPYGDPQSPQVQEFVNLIRQHLVEVQEDGSLWLDLSYFDYATGLRMVKERRWQELFGFPRRQPEDELLPEHCNLALAIQRLTEEIVLNMAKEAKRLTGARHLCMAGGVALNCVANGRLLQEQLFEDIWIQPAAGDAGGALGAAYCAYHIHGSQPRVCRQPDSMQGSYLGPEFGELDILQVAQQYQAPYRRFERFSELCATVAELLAQGHVVGWFQGRMEWGPRALGNRSILGDARNPEMQKKMNLKIKFREGFRPFAPSVLAEVAGEYFALDRPSPYMLLIAEVRDKYKKPLPADYHRLPWREKLYYVRSALPAITHIDYSARLQTVQRQTNPRYWQLLQAFQERTGCGVLVNTSFNVRGEPIVCTPKDAYRCFRRTEMDFLVLGDFLFDKKEQPAWQDTEHWQETFELD